MSDQLSFCPTLAEMAATGHAIGRSGKLIPIHSMSTLNNMLTLRALHLASRAGHTLEIGMRMGGSCLTFTQTHKDIGHEPARQHVAIDPYQSDPFNDASGLVAVTKAGLSDYLEFHQDFSAIVLPKLLKDGRRFSLIYIDGSHNFEDVFVDAYFSAELLSEGGTVVLDDAASPHIKKVLRFVDRNLNHCLKRLSLFGIHPNRSMVYLLAEALGRTNCVAYRKVGAFQRPYGYRLRHF